MAKSLKKMEETLDTVLKSISAPTAGDIVASTSSTQSPLSSLTLALEGVGDMNGLPEHPIKRDRSVSTAEGAGVRFENTMGRAGLHWGRKGSDLMPREPTDSPRLHSLPDNTLNPYASLSLGSSSRTDSLS